MTTSELSSEDIVVHDELSVLLSSISEIHSTAKTSYLDKRTLTVDMGPEELFSEIEDIYSEIASREK